ncbi:MAG: DegT/DnrJ/EryC1/StrS aminotransferase family protein [Candidatus Omnitrophica bacterium]|nr:DegT/DnrJ/EryC1/StrS aminotransferase family protein [Candidatus Omnitrophota bacterium]
MGIFKEIPPTAGFALYLKDILSSFSKKTSINALENDFKAYLKACYAQVTYSGTAAFYLILETIKQFSSKKTVVIPAFICPLIPLAIKRAGLEIIACDIQKDNFNFNFEELEKICLNNPDILAIVPTHLAGIPVDMNKTTEIAKKNGIFVIEDCAQSLGAEYNGRKIGSIGDFAFFSLCRGKGLTIYEGGVIAANNPEYGAKIDATIKQLVKNNFCSETLKVIELIGYWFIYRPQLFWWAYRLPQIFWNLKGQSLKAFAEYYTIDFDIHNVSNFRKKIGHFEFSRLENEITKQREKAGYYLEALKQQPGITTIRESKDDKATYPFLTILFNTPQRKENAFNKLIGSGLGIFQAYACAITDYDYLKEIIPQNPCPNAKDIAARHLTISTSTFLKNRDLETVINKLREF